MRYAFYPGCTFSSAAGYKESFAAVNERFGLVMEEIQDWGCCGATVSFSVSQEDGIFLGARTLAQAKQMGDGQVVTGCNACYTTLRKAQKLLKNDGASLERVNRRLAAEGLEADPEIAVRHHIEVLVNDVPAETWEEMVVTDHSRFNIAPYYGCQLTRPWKDMEPADILERLIRLSGFTCTDHSAKTLCCGAALGVPYAEDTKPLIQRISRAMTLGSAMAMTTVCPLCQLNMDQGQTALPVTYYTQIAGLGLGIDPDRLGLDKLLNPLKLEAQTLETQTMD